MDRQIGGIHHVTAIARETLGSALKLPPWLEPERKTIEGILPPVEVRTRETVGGAV